MKEKEVQELAKQLAKDFNIPDFKYDILWVDHADEMFFSSVANALKNTDIDHATAKITEIKKSAHVKFIWYVTTKDCKNVYPIKTVFDVDDGLIIKSKYINPDEEKNKGNKWKSVVVSFLSIALLMAFAFVNLHYSVPYQSEARYLSLAISSVSTFSFLYAFFRIYPNSWQCGLLFTILLQSLLLSTGNEIEVRMYGNNYLAIKLVIFILSFCLFNAIFSNLNSMAKNKSDGGK